MNAEEVLALIPARGGSKSLPRKNLKLLGGAPLVAWSIAAAHASAQVGRVLVSTDDPEIREASLAHGAEAPFLRPSELARDETPDLPVFLHALEWLEREEGFRPRLVVHLRPTSPLRPPGLVDGAISAIALRGKADSLRAACLPAQNPYKMWRVRGDYMTPLLVDFGPEAYNMPRQALPLTLWQTGHIDVVWRKTLLEKRSMTGDLILPFLVDPAYAVDIDTLAQWEMAEWLLEGGTLAVDRPRVRSTVT